jgi:hypothetical protein
MLLRSAYAITIVSLVVTREEPSWRPNRTGRKGWAVSRWGINRPRPVQIVACAATSLGWVAGLFEAQVPPNALPALTKMPCRWHFPHQRQGDGTHRRAAGNVLHSLVSSLPIGPPPSFISDRKLKICPIFGATQRRFTFGGSIKRQKNTCINTLWQFSLLA